MKKQIFTQGIEVYYRDYYGKIAFVGNQYLTLCICEFAEKVRNVNLLIYIDQWKDIKLKKESEK